MQYQPVVCVLHIVRGHTLQQAFFNLKRCFAGCQPSAATDAENVSIHRNSWLAKGDIQYNVGGFSAYAGQRFQRLARARHLPAVLLYEYLAGSV